MIDSKGRYQNHRIEGLADARYGTVVVDPSKVAWVGSMFVLGTIGSALTISLSALLVFVIATAISLLFGHSLGMHRLFIHRSYKCPRLLEYLFVHLGVLVGIAGPFGMLKTHDTRDWAQRQSHCHDFFAHRQVWYRDMVWQLFCSLRMDRPPDVVMEEGIRNDPVYFWMERTWMWQQLPWALLLFYWGGWGFVFWGICSRVSVSVFGHWVIGYFAHNKGGRRWHVDDASVQGFNVRWCALITMGESWHNNHHAFPGSAQLGVEPGQWDPGWWVLRILKKVKLVDDIKTPASFPGRAELRCIDENACEVGRCGNMVEAVAGSSQ